MKLELTTAFLAYREKHAKQADLWWPTILCVFGFPLILLVLDYGIHILEKASSPELDQLDALPISSHATKRYDSTFIAHPFKTLLKSLSDTRKPFKYSSSYEAIRLLLAPLEALAMIFSGTIRCVAIPLMTLGNLIMKFVKHFRDPTNPRQNAGHHTQTLKNGVIGTLNGCAQILVGGILLFATPFEWIIKPAIRHLVQISMSLEFHTIMPMIEYNDGIQHRVAMAETQGNGMAFSTCADIHRKFRKCLERGEETGVDERIEAQRFYSLTSHTDTANEMQTHRQHYLQLFPKKPAPVIDDSPVFTCENARAFLLD